ncbi:MAG: hypothetical protein EBS05_08250 [Proteobacteria bacterium]|nr:hypothetical protein [Pseudomonadota bacterium]
MNRGLCLVRNIPSDKPQFKCFPEDERFFFKSDTHVETGRFQPPVFDSFWQTIMPGKQFGWDPAYHRVDGNR